jgi:hypothetical protein
MARITRTPNEKFGRIMVGYTCGLVKEVRRHVHAPTWLSRAVDIALGTQSGFCQRKRFRMDSDSIPPASEIRDSTVKTSEKNTRNLPFMMKLKSLTAMMTSLKRIGESPEYYTQRSV